MQKHFKEQRFHRHPHNLELDEMKIIHVPVQHTILSERNGKIYSRVHRREKLIQTQHFHGCSAL